MSLLIDEIQQNYLNVKGESIVMNANTITITKTENGKRAKLIDELTKGLSPSLARGIRDILEGRVRRVR